MEYSTRESISLLAEQDPELTEYLKHNEIPGMPERKEELNNDKEYVLKVPMRDSFQSEIRVHKPISSSSTIPLVVLIYGGGFIGGDNTQLSSVARGIAALYGAIVVNISYRLAPEHKFPIAPNDVWDSLTWLSSNAQSLGADPTAGFILGGASAGANLAAVTAQKALNEKLSPPLTGVWLCVPVLLEQEIVPSKYKDLFFSREQNAEALMVNKKTMEHITACYEPDIYSPEYSPFNAKDPHKGLPPVYIQVCGQDPLRDDGLIYEKVLREHSVKTKLDVYPGVPHGHVMMASLKSAEKANRDTLRGVGWLLGNEASEEDIEKARSRYVASF